MAPIQLLLAALVAAAAAASGVRRLFPADRHYTYALKANVGACARLPAEGGTRWTLRAALHVRVHNDTGLTMALDDVQVNTETGQPYEPAQGLPPDASALAIPWEAQYDLDTGMLLAVVFAEEPLWSSNIKRALSISLQFVRVNSTDAFYRKGYTVLEPCLHDICRAEYSGVDTDTIRKTHAVPAATRGYGRSHWFSVRPDTCNKDFKKPFMGNAERVYRLDNNGMLDSDQWWYSVRPDTCTKDFKQPLIGNAERVYRLDEQGLLGLDLTSTLEYHSHNHLLNVVSELSLYRDYVAPLDTAGPSHAHNTTYHAYYPHTYKEPTNGRRPPAQQDLLKRTRELLTKLSENIDKDNVVRDADMIHNLDLMHLHKVMSQLNADSLKSLNNELHVGTSYVTETSRNIFFEVLPHVRSADSARLVKYLVIEFADQKFDEVTALSLIRKLPFNVAEYSRDLLMQMEDLLNLTPEVSQDIRHASILSFATLAFHTYINDACNTDDFEGYVQKYFRMYTECPSYADRLVWLQGLANLQVGSVSSYLGPLIQNMNASRHERFLAIWATMPLASFAPAYTTSLYWPILTNPKEHLQLRVSALAMLLHGEQSPGRILSLHHYVSSCDDDHLKRFWYTTVRSLEKSTYSCFQPLSKLTSYVSKLVRSPGQQFWATGNYIVDTSDADRDSAAMTQMWSIGDAATGLPAVAYLTLNTNQAGLITNQISVMVKAEGVSANFLKKLAGLNYDDIHMNTRDLLKKMKVELKSLEKVHIEIIVSVQGKTVYASHLNQTTFDKWTGNDMVNTVKDFLMSESHVNQQLVQYPLQTELNLPTELGTPVTLQTMWSSFFSVRGTMTSPSSGDGSMLVRTNDIHFRYHGTALTTLSTFGPVLGSDHSVTLEQSLVAHLPLKFNSTLSLIKKTLHLAWLNEDETGGVAIHSRSQVSYDVGHDGEQPCSGCQGTKTITRITSGVGDQDDSSGFYFDCDRPMTGAELLEKLLDSNRANYEFFSSLRPSLIVVHGLFLLSVPPAGACGVIVPSRFPFHLPPGASLDLTLQLEQLEQEEEIEVEPVTLRLHHALFLKSALETILNVNGSTVLENTSKRFRVATWLAGYRPNATDVNRRYWQVCVEQTTDVNRVPSDQDISSYPAPFEGRLKVMFAASAEPAPRGCPDGGSHFTLEYSGRPEVNNTSQELTRNFDVHVFGKNLPKMTFLSELGIDQIAKLGQVLQKITADPLNVTAAIQERNGLANITIEHGPTWQFRTDNFNWLLDYWSKTQLLRKFGIYRECRVQENTIHTLDGVIDQLNTTGCSESLILGDCTDKSRFALTRMRDGGYSLYLGGDRVTLGPNRFYDSTNTVDTETMRRSGVQLFYRPTETAVLVSATYMPVACGACVGGASYTLCP